VSAFAAACARRYAARIIQGISFDLSSQGQARRWQCTSSNPPRQAIRQEQARRQAGRSPARADGAIRERSQGCVAFSDFGKRLGSTARCPACSFIGMTVRPRQFRCMHVACTFSCEIVPFPAIPCKTACLQPERRVSLRALLQALSLHTQLGSRHRSSVSRTTSAGFLSSRMATKVQ
jgi:hypothetical protein